MNHHYFDHLPDAWIAAIEAFLVEAQNHSGSVNTRILYQSTLRRFLSDERLPSDYSRSDVIAFLSAPSTSRRNPGMPVTPNTHNSRLQILNSLFRFASSYEVDGQPIWPQNRAIPSFGIKYVKCGNKPRVLEVYDLERILEHLPGETEEKRSRDRSLLLFYWLTGKRRSEVQRLTWGDLAFTTVVDSDGTRRQSVVFAFRSKGRSREVQHAELPRPAWLALEHYLKVSGRLEHMQAEDWLFTSSRQYKGKRPLSKDYLNRIFKNAVEACGLDAKDLSLHVLRHSIARTRFLDGQDLVSLKEFLGHSSLQTTFLYVQGLTSTSDSFALKLEEKYRFLSGVPSQS